MKRKIKYLISIIFLTPVLFWGGADPSFSQETGDPTIEKDVAAVSTVKMPETPLADKILAISSPEPVPAASRQNQNDSGALPEKSGETREIGETGKIGKNSGTGSDGDGAVPADSSKTGGENTSSQVRGITLQDAVNLTLANNIDLKLFEKQIDARKLDQDKADFFSDKLRDADEKISDGWSNLHQARTDLQKIEAGLNAGLQIPMQGTDKYWTMEDVSAAKKQLAAAESELRTNSKYEITTLENAQVTELFQTKAYLGLNVTQLGYEIAREKYALLTRQKYYDVLKAQRLVAVKEAALKRAETQAKMARDSFEAGFRSKDDMLMAQAQLSLIKADLAQGKNALKQAEIELKKVMYIDMEEKLKLTDDFTTDRDIVDLNQGLKQALAGRVEIKKAEMELQVAEINMELAKRYTAPKTFDYRQIRLDLENAQLGLKQQEETVKGDVNSSYQTVLATREMLDAVTGSVKQAREAVEIAEYRYREGYGIDSSVLKSLNMEDAGGTIFEVMAAQEKLSEVEEKVVNIIYGYNLAKSKYQVDICAQ